MHIERLFVLFELSWFQEWSKEPRLNFVLKVEKLFYRDIMDWLLKQIWHVRPEFYQSGEWFLVHENVPTHSIVVFQFLASKNVTIIIHPPYSPDLAPADFFLFSKIKLVMEMTRYEDMKAIQRTVREYLNAISQKECDFPRLYEHSIENMVRGEMYVEK